LDEGDESETGSANSLDRPPQGAGSLLGSCPKLRLIGADSPRQALDVEPEDIRLLFEVLFDIRSGVHRALWLLEEEDDEEEDS
jgi:hypothetical protein